MEADTCLNSRWRNTLGPINFLILDAISLMQDEIQVDTVCTSRWYALWARYTCGSSSARRNTGYTRTERDAVFPNAPVRSRWHGTCNLGATKKKNISLSFSSKNLQVPLISRSMTRDRYFKVRSNLKVVFDTDVPDDVKSSDRLWKVRPLLERVRKGSMS